MGEWDPCLSFPRAGDLLGAAAFAPFLTQSRWQASWPHPGHLTVGTRGVPRSPVTSQLSHPTQCHQPGDQLWATPPGAT